MYNAHDEEFKKLYNKILNEGNKKDDRTGVGTISYFGYQARFKMSDGFPLFTLRKIHTKSLVHELLWFLGSYDEKYNKFGNTNIRYLVDNGVSFWNDWPYENYKKKTVDKYLDNDLKNDKTIKKLKILNVTDFVEQIKSDDEFALKWGELGSVYGHQWLNFGGYTEQVEMTKSYEINRNGMSIVDSKGWVPVKHKGVNQIDNVIELLKTDPDSRRMIVTAWNPTELDDMLLPCCHYGFQLYTSLLTPEEKKIYPNKERKISLKMHQRSLDSYLGGPFNVASYTILLYMFAQIANMVPYEFIWNIGDAHLYNNSIEATKTVIARESFTPCKLVLNPDIKDIYDFRYDDIKFENYQSHDNIKVDVAV